MYNNINKETVKEWIVVKVNGTNFTGMSLVAVYRNIVEIMYILGMQFSEIASCVCPNTTEQYQKSGIDSRQSSVLGFPLFVDQKTLRRYKLSNNHDFRKLFHFSTYSTKLESFKPYLTDHLFRVIFCEFLNDNGISYLIIKNILSNFGEYRNSIFMFFYKHVGKLSVGNKMEILKYLEMFYLSDSSQKMDSGTDLSEKKPRSDPEKLDESIILILILIFRNDNNSTVSKEYCKYFGTIHGTKRVKKRISDIYRIVCETVLITDFIDYCENEIFYRYDGVRSDEHIESSTLTQMRDTSISVSSSTINTMLNMQFLGFIDEFIMKYPNELISEIHKEFDLKKINSKILMRCLENKFKRPEIMNILLKFCDSVLSERENRETDFLLAVPKESSEAEKLIQEMLNILDNSIFFDFLIENDKTSHLNRRIYGILPDELLIKKIILNGEIGLMEFLRDKSSLYLEILGVISGERLGDTISNSTEKHPQPVVQTSHPVEDENTEKLLKSNPNKKNGQKNTPKNEAYKNTEAYKNSDAYKNQTAKKGKRAVKITEKVYAITVPEIQELYEKIKCDLI